MPKYVFETTGGPWTKNGLRGKIVERGFGIEAANEQAFAEAQGLAPVVLTPSECIQEAKRRIEREFDWIEMDTMQDKLMSVREAGTLASHPKLAAVYTWLQTVKGMAVQGSTNFPACPHTFEEVIAE